jgi:hypothetical protein
VQNDQYVESEQVIAEIRAGTSTLHFKGKKKRKISTNSFFLNYVIIMRTNHTTSRARFPQLKKKAQGVLIKLLDPCWISLFPLCL